MRLLPRLLYAIAFLVAAGAVVFFIWVQGMACGYSHPQGNCPLRMPWELQGEDLEVLVLLPLAMVAVPLLLGWLAARVAKRKS